MSCYGKSLLPHLLSIHNHFMGIFTLVIHCLAKQLELRNSPCDMYTTYCTQAKVSFNSIYFYYHLNFKSKSIKLYKFQFFFNPFTNLIGGQWV